MHKTDKVLKAVSGPLQSPTQKDLYSLLQLTSGVKRHQSTVPFLRSSSATKQNSTREILLWQKILALTINMEEGRRERDGGRERGKREKDPSEI